MRQLFLLDNICTMHTSTVNKSSFIKDLACGPSLGLQNLMWPSGLKSLPTSGLVKCGLSEHLVLLFQRSLRREFSRFYNSSDLDVQVLNLDIYL